MNEQVNGKFGFSKLGFSGWAKMCLTMVDDAIEEGDVEFFLSEWGQTILDAIELYYSNQNLEFDRKDILNRTKANHRKLQYSASNSLSIFDI